MLSEILAALAFPSFVDSVLRLRLHAAARHSGSVLQARIPGRWLVLIPARGEGPLVESTLRSVVGQDQRTQALLLLDGEDPVAASIARELGASVVVKSPAGPTKVAALRWLAEHHPDRIRSVDAVLLLDVGSILPEEFFTRFSWVDGAHAVQTFLRGTGSGVGSAAALSENRAQHQEDVGRQNLGWNVRLRGTGMAFLPETFLRIIPRLRSQVEDLEASLIIPADGMTIRMGPTDAPVLDEKPAHIHLAAWQRARWLAGRYSVLFGNLGAFASIMRRNAAEGIAFFFEIFGRPYSLTIPLRAIAGLLLCWDGGLLRIMVGGALLISAVLDFAQFAVYGNWKHMGGIGLAWLQALLNLPRALTHWIRARK